MLTLAKQASETIVMFSPLPPAPSGIADYTSEILPLLNQAVTCVVVVDDVVHRPSAPDGVRVLTLADYEREEQSLTKLLHVYHVGNNPMHLYMLGVMARNPGLIVLHDPSLHHLLDCATVANGELSGYTDALETEYGVCGRVLGEQFRAHHVRDVQMFYDMPMTGGVVGPSRGVIVHSHYAAAKVLSRAPWADVTVVPHHYGPLAPDGIRPRTDVRRSLGIGDSEVLFLSLGFVTRAKRIEDTLHVLAAVRDRLPPFRYVIAGELRPDEVDVATLIADLGLSHNVTALGYVSEKDFLSLIRAADVVVNLRHPIGGETSGSMIRAMGAGACIVVVDRGPFAEIPDGAACKLRWDGQFAMRLADALLTLARKPDLRHRIGRAARETVLRNNAIEATVAGYLTAIAKATDTAHRPWRSKVVWEILPPHELTRARRETASGAAEPQPLWYRSGAVPTSTRPCRAAAWASPSDRDLLTRLGHSAELRSLTELTNLTGEDSYPPRTLDLVLIRGTTDEVSGHLDWLRLVNRVLAFGGLVVVNLETTSDGVRHPLQRRPSGTQAFARCGFRVDEFTTAALPDLGGTTSDLADSRDERCWRAVKVSEYLVTDAHLLSTAVS